MIISQYLKKSCFFWKRPPLRVAGKIGRPPAHRRGASAKKVKKFAAAAHRRG